MLVTLNHYETVVLCLNLLVKVEIRWQTIWSSLVEEKIGCLFWGWVGVGGVTHFFCMNLLVEVEKKLHTEFGRV